MKCKYEYKQKRFKDKKCPYEAQPGSDYCKWHEKKDGKDFSGQTIQDTDLVEAYLVKANLYNAKFKEKTDLSFANLQEANLSYANLQGVNLYNANLQGAKLYGTNIQQTNLFLSNFKNADLRKADFKGVNLGLTNFEEANLLEVDFQGEKLHEANFEEANLSHAKLQDAELIKTNFQKADLSYANLSRANLSLADLKDGDLSFAKLQGADLYGADLTDTLFNEKSDLRGTFLHAAKIKNAKGLQYAKMSNKCIEEVIADKIDEILNSDKKYEDALKDALNSEFKDLGLENEITKSLIIKANIDIYEKDTMMDRLNELDPQKIIDNAKKSFKAFIEEENLYTSETTTLRGVFDSDKMEKNEQLYHYKLYLYEKAQDVYINLKNYFKDIGYYDESGKFFIAEFRVRGKIYRIRGDQIRNVLWKRVKHTLSNLIFWKKRKSEKTDKENQVDEVTKELTDKKSNLNKEKSITLVKRMLANYFAFSMNRLSSITSLYGESVGRVMATAFGIIFFYSLLFLISGAVESNSHAVRSFWDSFYFSIVTFTTLGYGDLHPVAKTWTRLTAGSEAFLGAFIIAYFVVVVSRKIMR